MKIAYVITRSDIMGGASVHLLDLAEGMSHSGHQIMIFVGGDGVLVQKAAQRNLACETVQRLVREIRPIEDILCYFELRSKLKHYQPDIIHLHSSKAGLIGRLVARNLGVPSVFTAHGWAFTEGVTPYKRRLYLFLERFAGRYAKKIIAVSDYDKNLALELGVGRPESLVTIHNGMSDGSYSFKKEAGVEKRFIMVARFDEPKDQFLLVNAFSRVSRQDWHLELVGDGPSIENVRSLVYSLGLIDKITFSGARDDVDVRLWESDIFCLISNWEGLPLTILEAMRGGLPVIASDVGGVAEAVVGDQTGLLVKRGDLNGITMAIERLLESDDKRYRLGKAGRLRYEEKFTFGLMLQKTLAVYQEAVGPTP